MLVDHPSKSRRPASGRLSDDQCHLDDQVTNSGTTIHRQRRSDHDHHLGG